MDDKERIIYQNYYIDSLMDAIRGLVRGSSDIGNEIRLLRDIKTTAKATAEYKTTMGNIKKKHFDK